MFGSIDELTWDTALVQLDGVLDFLQSAGLDTLSGDQELEVLRRLETQKNRFPTVEHRLIGDVESRGTAREHACKTTANLLIQVLRINPREAGARVKAAAQLGPRRGLSGELLPAQFPQVAAAQAAGEISSAHASVITHTIEKLPDTIRDENEDFLEESLLEQAYSTNPYQLAQIAQAMAYLLDQDGKFVQERERHRNRDLRITRRTDGSAHLEGELTALCAEALLSTLQPLAGPAKAEDGVKDPRTPGQRLHDALYDAALIALRSQKLPECGGYAATIVLHMTPEHVERGTGLVTTGHGAQISAAEALTLLGDARIFPVLLNHSGEILAYGSSRRIFTEGQRLAMIARDQGCSFPGCTLPPALSQAHHVTDYAITRRTTVADGTLVCGFHHREYEILGYTCQMIGGIPHWTAPRWIDPSQTPRRNRAHTPLSV
ncbi:MAG: hypothetical protein QOC73_624 [Actinomycetota bacterium]|jgi:hypothetical protein|nr:hypothetical protein [Actinomycetota bacterium]